MDAERERLRQAGSTGTAWRRWGPYLSERQWGTVREDYSPYGDAWSYFPHEHARSRAYRWGEDGLGGISDDKQRLCLSVALWNGRDPGTRASSTAAGCTFRSFSPGGRPSRPTPACAPSTNGC